MAHASETHLIPLRGRRVDRFLRGVEQHQKLHLQAAWTTYAFYGLAALLVASVAFALVVEVPEAGLRSWQPWVPVALFVLLAAAGLWQYYAGRRVQELRLFCPGRDCKKYIPHYLRWQCPYCLQVFQSEHYSFLDGCPECKEKGEGYQCHRCGGVMPLAKLEPDEHAVIRRFSPPEKGKSAKEKHQDEVTARNRTIDLLRRDREIARLERAIKKYDGGIARDIQKLRDEHALSRAGRIMGVESQLQFHNDLAELQAQKLRAIDQQVAEGTLTKGDAKKRKELIRRLIGTYKTID